MFEWRGNSALVKLPSTDQFQEFLKKLILIRENLKGKKARGTENLDSVPAMFSN